MTPCAASRPAGSITAAVECETLFRKCTGFQPISCALRMAWAAAFGVATFRNASAPDAFAATIWLSTVASVTS